MDRNFCKLDGKNCKGKKDYRLYCIHCTSCNQYYWYLSNRHFGKSHRGHAKKSRVFPGYTIFWTRIWRNNASWNCGGHRKTQRGLKTFHPEKDGRVGYGDKWHSRTFQASFGRGPGKIFQTGLLQRHTQILPTAHLPREYFYNGCCPEISRQRQPTEQFCRQHRADSPNDYLYEGCKDIPYGNHRGQIKRKYRQNISCGQV